MTGTTKEFAALTNAAISLIQTHGRFVGEDKAADELLLNDLYVLLSLRQENVDASLQQMLRQLKEEQDGKSFE